MIELITQNIGPANPQDILELADKTAILALQEAGDRGAIKTQLRRRGFGVINPSRFKGATSTPLVYDPNKVKLLRERVILTSRAQYAGPGAGPDRVKSKYLVGGSFKDLSTGTKFRAFSTHYVASSYTNLREKIALIESRAFAKRFHKGNIPTFVLGDFNAVPHDNVLAPLYANGWTNDEEFGNLHTHGKRAIDYIWWLKNSRVRFYGHSTIRTSSDHNAVVAEFII